ncbi:MAG: UvrD-helicase domain-containing protein [Paludisphaera borealis]|uniref:UvrD-helicase domain-containing protein n=1 Tax=Paludisphaera borealis TaxID=1387353 RepID=UPI002840A7E1|nr:UvrD-helicase domain-containing protein [Paludisphaera borealis]MDR3622469.1 UvrD-helicase domain-containing protein [Paludisphaera borealis]
MSSRAQQCDTDADRELYSCLNASPPRSFLMMAGAGSGKTTSLIKGLGEILNKHGERLKLRRQKVACITYTDVAVGEIWADVGNNPLVHVSTIHSFLWSLARPFQADIQEWTASRIDEQLVTLREEKDKFGPRVQQRTRAKNQSDIERYQQQRERSRQVDSFTYGTGSDYAKGILGHDDIIRMVPQLIVERPLLRRLIVQQYPFLFVDESQDTAKNVVTALKCLDKEFGSQLCLGFFGDPMQRIYMTGIGAIPADPGWANIKKPENFRCPKSVLNVANAIRRAADDLVQTRGRMTGPDDGAVSVPGSARFIILPIDEYRDQRIAQVRAWAARKNEDPKWHVDEHVKLLVVVHRLAAKQMRFGELYAALNDKAPKDFKNGFLDGTAWPVRPFVDFILPLVNASKNDDAFEVMQILRSRSPLLARDNLIGVDVARRLSELRQFTETLQRMMEPGASETNADVLKHIHTSNAYSLDQRILSYLELSEQAEAEKDENANAEDDGEELTKSISAMDAFLACPASQFLGYYQYVNNESPFSTQQGVKGAQFDRVLVVIDDDAASHVQFSYDKYLGLKPLSDKEESNRSQGGETTVERTRRLFYVCCTRALKDLVVVLFTENVEAARRQISLLQLFPDDAIHLGDEIAVYSDP